MKAVLLGSHAEARLIDVAHNVPAQSVVDGEVLLRSIAYIFGPGSVHLMVIDPGVGTSRLPIAVESQGVYFVGPDNGLFGQLKQDPNARAVVLNRSELFRKPVSNTFHGRDIFSPVAAELAGGLSLEDVGSPIPDWMPGALSAPQWVNGEVEVPLIATDSFGNILTHLHARDIVENFRIFLENIEIPFVSSYGHAKDDRPVALLGSDGYLEVAVKNGSAAETLGADWQSQRLTVSSIT